MALLSACGDVKSNVDAAVPNDTSSQDADDADDAPPACEPNTAKCIGTELATCDGQGNLTMTPCALGCNANESRCNKVNPSNGLAMYLDEAENAPDVTLVGAATIDTTNGTITDESGARALPTATVNASPVGLLVVKVKSLTTGGKVTVTGTRALAIVSAGDVSIGHVVSVSAAGATPGPGAVTTDATCRGGNAAEGNAEGRAGGGGGGFGTMGGQGGIGGNPSVTAGARGGISGNPELVPLRGGCSGGRSSGAPASYAPGAGGGALQIVSNTKIQLTAGGVLAANGSGGRRTTIIFVPCVANTPCGYGEGGGSGGGILLEAPVVDIGADSGVYANGGGGSCDVGGAAQDGQNSTTPAAGQQRTTPTGNGGNGAAGNVSATNGVGKTGNDSGGGGGGGGLGRIRVNLAAGATFSPAGETSGTLTVGTLATR